MAKLFHERGNMMFGVKRTEDDKIASVNIYLEAWKRVIDTQEHFNDISMRVRGLLGTCFSALFLFAAYLLKDSDINNEKYIIISILFFYVIIALSCLFAEKWYRNFLISAVKVGEDIEEKLKTYGYEAIQLTTQISCDDKNKKINSQWFFRLFYFFQIFLPICVICLLFFKNKV